jgi:SAM-dependent methyltransferase
MTWHIQETHIFFNPRYPQRERHALVHPALLRWIAAEAPQTMRVLDVGCGAGRLTLAVAPLAAEVIGLDRDGAALMLGQQRTTVANIANVRFLEVDVEDLPYSALLGADSIGMVVANLCMSQAIMARAHAVLPRGGCLIFAALHSAQWQETGRASRFAYDAHELRQFLDWHGWQCEAMEIDREVLHLQQVADLEQYFIMNPLRQRWQQDGRWERLVRYITQGGDRLTVRSNVLVKARKT